MPIYEYHCEKCGDFDVMQKITAKPLRRCPTCKSKVSKLISNTAFQLKGTGWYVTDYAGKGKSGKDEAKADSGAEKSADAGSTKASGDGATKDSSKGSSSKKAGPKPKGESAAA